LALPKTTTSAFIRNQKSSGAPSPPNEGRHTDDEGHSPLETPNARSDDEDGFSNPPEPDRPDVMRTPNSELPWAAIETEEGAMIRSK
jgi:hypothetical protein